jgi:methyl-accepting chemotaxis protein PixJ
MMNSTYDQSLVALSIVIAICASYTALDLAGRVSIANKKVRLAWLIGGAVAMGIGIWSMHFVAMLAFSLPMPIAYDMWTVTLSILPAIIASGGALFLASRRVLNIQQLLSGGVLMGFGIASMHYIGMAAMRMNANTEYKPVLFALSLMIAIGASVMALAIAFQLRMHTGKSGRRQKMLSALIMAAAISGMHYTGMTAASFKPMMASTTVSQVIQPSMTWLAVGIGIATLIILGFTLLSSFIDQQILAQKFLLKQRQTDVERSQLLTEITLRIRQSLNLDDVLNATVNEIRQALNIDRTVVYRFNRDWSGTIIAESVAPNWAKILGTTVNDPLREDLIEMYKNGRVRATNNIYTAGFTDCHREILESFQIRASIVAPIIIHNQLLGLLCGHQCSGSRAWQPTEIDLFRHLAIQVGIALEQANLMHELSTTQEVLRVHDRAIATVSEGIVISDPCQPGNPIIFCNPAFETITGYSAKEAIGRNCRFLQGSDTDPATIEQLRNAVREERECQVVIKNYRKDGTPFWNQLTISPVRDTTGQVINFIGVQADIKESQSHEQVSQTKQALQHQLVELLSDVEEASRGDLCVRAQMTFGEIGIVADFFNAVIENLQKIVISVKHTAQQVNVSVEENSDTIRQLSDEALKQAEEINGSLESLEQMAISIQAVAQNAYKAVEMARSASTTAEAGRTAIEHSVSNILNLHSTVATATQKVKRLGKSSQEISKVVSLIEKIALQTNVLSIKTSIEAARVGEEGRAFAVVAEEVGQLAMQSTQATKEIEQIIENIQFETQEVVKAVELGMKQVVEGTDFVKNAKLHLEQILEVSCQIDELVQSISSSTVSQALTSQAVASFMKQVAHGSLRTGNLSRQVSSSLQQTVAVTQQLQASVGVFKTE